MPGKGVQLLVFRRYWEGGELFRSSSNFLADKKTPIPLATLQGAFKELEIAELASSTNRLALQGLVKNTKAGECINMGKLLKLIPKGATSPCEIRVLPDMPEDAGGNSTARRNQNIFLSLLANKYWNCPSFPELAQKISQGRVSYFTHAIMSTDLPDYPKVLFIMNDSEFVICFGTCKKAIGLDKLRSFVLSVPIYTILNEFLLGQKRRLIITGSLYGGISAQLLTLQILESEPSLQFEISCVTFNAPSFTSSELLTSFNAHSSCFINVLQSELIPRLAMVSALEYVENMSDELKLSEDMQDALDAWDGIKNGVNPNSKNRSGHADHKEEDGVEGETNSEKSKKSYSRDSLTLSSSLALKFAALLLDSSISYIGDVILLKGQDKCITYPSEDHDFITYSEVLGSQSLPELLNEDVELYSLSKHLLQRLEAPLISYLDTKGYSKAPVKEVSVDSIQVLKGISPEVTTAKFASIWVSTKKSSLRLTITGKHLDSVFKPLDETYNYVMGTISGGLPLRLSVYRGLEITCYVESMTPDEIMIRTSPLDNVSDTTLDGNLNSIFACKKIVFEKDNVKYKGLSPAEMKQLGLNEEGLLRMIGILFLDLEEEVRNKSATRPQKLTEALSCLERIEMISKGLKLELGESILVNVIEEELKKESPDITHVITVARPIINAFIEEMSKPLLLTQKSLGERLGIAFKAKLSLITGGFLKRLGKHNSTLAYKGERMSQGARYVSKFNEANIRYTSVLKLLASILNNNKSYIGMGLADLETFVVEKYNTSVFDHSLVHGDVTSPIASLESIIRDRRKELTEAKSKDFEEISLMGILLQKEYKDTLVDLTRRLIASGQLSTLRDSFSRVVCISFVGTHNAGKSTMMQNLFNIDTDPSFFERTLQVTSFRPPIYNAIKIDEQQSRRTVFSSLLRTDLRFLDFPGATDERESIRAQTSLLLGLSTIVVIVFNAVHIAQPECQIMDLVKSKNIPYIVLLNQVDKVKSNLLLENADIIRDDNEDDEEQYEEKEHKSGKVKTKKTEDSESDQDSISGMTASADESSSSSNSNSDSDAEASHEAKPAEAKEEGAKTMNQLLAELKTACAGRLHVDEKSILLTSSFNTLPVKVELLGQLKSITSIEKKYLSILIAGNIYKVIINQSDDFVKQVYAKIDEEGDSYLFRKNTLSKFLLSRKVLMLRGPRPDWQNFVKPSEVNVLRLLIYRKKLTSGQIISKLLEAYEEPTREMPTNNLELFGIKDVSSIPSFSWNDILCIELTSKGTFAKYEGNPVTIDIKEAMEWVTNFATAQRSKDKKVMFLSEANTDAFMTQFLELRPAEFKQEIIIKDGSEAIDCGGVINSYIMEMCKKISALAVDKSFEPIQASRSNTLYMSPDFILYPPELRGIYDQYMRLIFRLIAFVLSQAGRTKNFFLSCSLNLIFFKILLGYPLTISDIESMNVTAFNSIKTLVTSAATNNIEDLYLTTTYLSPSDEYCQHLIWPKKTNQIDLTNENVESYINATIDYLLLTSYDFGPILRDFNEIFPIAELQQRFTPVTLHLMCCGTQHIDKIDLVTNIDFINFEENGKSEIRREWLRELVLEFTEQEASLFVGFFTGSLIAPLGGFSALKPRMSIYLDDLESADNLPTGSTCFNRMTIPIYPTKKIMKQKLILAISNCTNTDFGTK